ncbi:ChbG/HpnK family deacetylase [bacterium]|nr:ChbG/HpnK family deacetylase [bacterium]
MKKVIINADDFGYSENNNIAIKKGFEKGIITSTSLLANMTGFEHAIKEIVPQIENIDIGFHFNIMEGKSLSDCNLLCNTEGFFQNSYQKLIIKSKEKIFLNQLEKEFRTQIEKVMAHCKISHIDSHVHTHAIPDIFNLLLKLANEYKIGYIRTQKELPYIVPNKVLSLKFPVNIIKNLLLNTYTYINEKELINYEIKTNDYFIGVLYTGYMDEKSIINGLKQIKKENSVTEVIFHPYYANSIPKEKQHNYEEFLITQNPHLKKEIENMGFVLSDYSA